MLDPTPIVVPGSRTLPAVGCLKTARLAVMFLVVFALNTVGLYAVFTSRGEYAIWDIHSTLVASRAVLHGQDPYSAEVTEAIWRQLYARPARPDENAHAFFYPAYVAYLAVPLGMLPLPWAQAIWLSLLEGSVVAGFAVIVGTWEWPRGRLARALMLVYCILFYPVVWGFILGQIALVAFALLMLAVHGVQRRWDGLAGVALGLSIVKPQLAFLVVPGVIAWAAARRRWRLLASTCVTVGGLVALPAIFQPNWIASFLRQLMDYQNPFTAPAIVAAERCCAIWDAAGWLGPLLVVAILGAVAFGWWVAARGGRDADFLWAVGITLIATTAVAPQISTVNQVVLLLPIFGAVKMLFSKRLPGMAVALGMLLLWGGGLWLLSWLPPVSTAQLRYPVEHRVLSPVVPITLALIWLAGRAALTRPAHSSQTAGAFHYPGREGGRP